MLRLFKPSTVLAAALVGLVCSLSLAAQADESCTSCQAAGGAGCAACRAGKAHCRGCRDGVCRHGACRDGSCPGCRQGLGGGKHFYPNCRPQQYGRPDLFYNFYVPPVCGGIGAQMYVAPQPVPQWVGHTYYTYQPLMPHEMLYPHHRTYHRYYDGGRGFTRTHVKWYNPPLITGVKSLANLFEIAR